jgi:hypothetical protein
MGTLSGSRRVSLSGCRSKSSRANSASVGSSLAPLVVNAAPTDGVGGLSASLMLGFHATEHRVTALGTGLDGAGLDVQ